MPRFGKLLGSYKDEAPDWNAIEDFPRISYFQHFVRRIMLHEVCRPRDFVQNCCPLTYNCQAHACHCWHSLEQ